MILCSEWLCTEGMGSSHMAKALIIFSFHLVTFLIATLFKLGPLPSLGWKWALSQWQSFLMNLSLLSCDL